MGLIRNEFVCLKKVTNFCFIVGIRFSKLERIGIILETNHGSDGFNPERIRLFVCLKKMANFHIALEHDFQSWKESE